MTTIHDPQARHAMARLIALTLMADGRLANFELAALDAHHIPTVVGVSRDAILQAVVDLCREMLDEAPGARVRVVDPAHVDALLDAIAEAGHREVALRALLVLSKADGAISPPEQAVLGRAMARWDMTLAAIAA